MKESDLYPPVKRFLEAQGFEVKSEIHHCDVLAIRGEEAPVVVELKLRVNLEVILQAVDRLAVTDTVYMGVPSTCAALKSQRKRIIRLVKMLGLGLLSIEPDAEIGAVDVLCDPKAYRPRAIKPRRDRLLGEFLQRVGDPNRGGSAMRRGIMTAYRQKALAIARFLKTNGPTKASVVASSLPEPKARDVLYRNVYGWFERASQGIYDLSPRGREEIELWQEAAPGAIDGTED